MVIRIRGPRLEPLIDGIPRDFAQVRDYFNLTLKTGTLPWIPRKTPITNEEITKLWIPSLNTNLNLVAELGGHIIGQVTVFYDTKSSAYEHANQRVSGSVGLTAKPYIYNIAVPPLITGLIKSLRFEGKSAIWTTAIESPGNEIIEKLGYTPEILENQERYKQAGLSGKVCKYSLP